jgi:hypothetical protein
MRDCLALGRLLQQLLPPRGDRWWGEPLSAVYEICDAAIAGAYNLPMDLADDLGRASRQAALRSRERWAALLLSLLVFLPVFLFLATRFVERPGADDATPLELFLSHHVLLLLAPGAVVLGLLHGRSMLRRLGATSRQQPCRFLSKRGLMPRPFQLALLAAPLALGAQSLMMGRGVMAVMLILGFWFVGFYLAGLLGVGELLMRRFWATASVKE